VDTKSIKRAPAARSIPDVRGSSSGVPRNYVRGGSTNSVEDNGQREGDVGEVAP
jgi:hypothetical protein